jgi:Leucine-rich repeat (LRR) protein
MHEFLESHKAVTMILACLAASGCGDQGQPPRGGQQQSRQPVTPQLETDVKFLNEAIELVKAGRTSTIDISRHPNIGDEQLKALRGLKGLRFLRADNIRVTSRGLEHLATLPDLQGLWLSNTAITDAGLKRIARIKSLRVLVIDRVRITDNGLAALVQLPNLEHLSLWRNYITDAGCRHIGRMSELRHLSLDETKVTDAGLKHLRHLKNLEYLSVWRTDVTDEGIRELKRALPELNVNR